MVLGASATICGQRALEKWARDHQTAFMRSIISLIPKEERIEVSSQQQISVENYNLSDLSRDELETLRALLGKAAKPVTG